jgi:cytochrome P450
MPLSLSGRLRHRVAHVLRTRPIERARCWLLRRPIHPEQIDLAAPEWLENPFPAYEILRRGGPVRYLPQQGFWAVLGYDELRQVCTQPEVFSNSAYEDIDAVLIGRDPPAHTAVRRLVAQQFAPATLERITAPLEGRVMALLTTQFDAVKQFAIPLASGVAAELAGFDEHTAAQVHAAHEASQRTASPIQSFIRSLDTLADRAAVFQILMRDGKDFLSDAQARSVVRFLWLASTTTTQRVIAQSILCLLQRPQLHAKLRAEPSLIPAYIEEVMRLHPPEHMLPRRATCVTALGGVTIPAGALVQLCLAAANRDPREFVDAGSLRLDREKPRHLSFGFGAHHCSGTALSRRVLPIVLTHLLQNAPGLHAAQSLSNVEYLSTPTTFTPARLMVGT